MPIPTKWTDEQKEALIHKLEMYLSAYDPKISIDLRDQPMKIIGYINGIAEEPKYFWIDAITVQVAGLGDIEAHIHEDFLNINNDKSIWEAAFNIQNAIQHALHREQIFSKEWQDRYWKLWDHL